MDVRRAAFGSFSDEAIVHLQNDMIHDYLSMKKQCGDDFNIYYLPYSRGGKETYQASLGLPQEMRNKISVYTLGSLKVIPGDMFKKALNYQNPNDAVCKIANFCNNHENANIIDTGYRGGFPVTTAHYLSSEGYDLALQDLCKNILKEELK